jgi:hypothetical protein
MHTIHPLEPSYSQQNGRLGDFGLVLLSYTKNPCYDLENCNNKPYTPYRSAPHFKRVRTFVNSATHSTASNSLINADSGCTDILLKKLAAHLQEDRKPWKNYRVHRWVTKPYRQIGKDR